MRDCAEDNTLKIIEIAEYIIDNDATLRNAESNILVPRSTMHKYMHEDLRHISVELYDQVMTIFKRHKKEVINRMNKARRWKRK